MEVCMLKTILKVLLVVASQISPFLRKEIGAWLDSVYKKALGTPNPNDDLFVEALAEVLGHDLKED
jgi:hypothetical protein